MSPESGVLTGTYEGGKRPYRAVILVLPFILGFFPFAAAYADHLTASGCSVSNVGYLSELAKEYERKTGVKVFVRGGGTVIGIEDIKSGNVDFAAACRAKAPGDPNNIRFIQVAWDALVFIAHKSNRIDDITLQDVRAIYAGKKTNWSELKGDDAPIRVFISRSRRGLSGVESSTRELVLNGEEPVKTPHTVFLASSAIVEQMVEETPSGFATSGFSSAQKRNVKMLKVNGTYPSAKTIIRNRYPLKRPLFIIVTDNPKPEVKRFVDFALSAEGQQFISSQGVVSLLDMK